MPRCYLCDKKWTLGKTFHRDNETFCEACAALWPEERKKRAMALLCDGGDPVEVFSIPKVTCISPDYPKNQIILMGLLAFTDKGVCFIVVHESRRPSSSWGIMFGVIGAGIAAAAWKRRVNKAHAESQERVLAGVQSFMELLSKSPRLMVFPRGEITDIGYSWLSSKLCIQRGKRTWRFGLEGGRKTYRVHQAAIEKYVEPKTREVNPYA